MALYLFTPRDTAAGVDRFLRDGNRRVTRFEREELEEEAPPRSGAKSPTGIANLALSFIGAKTLVSIDDNTHEGRVMRMFYEQNRDALLRSHRWNFAQARVTLNKLTTAPDSQWSFQFTLPADVLRVLQVNGRDQYCEPSNWHVEGLRLLSNAEVAQVLYIRKVEDVKEFDPLFTEALYLAMAGRAADILIGDHKLAAQIREQYAAKVATVARLADEWEGNTRIRPAWERAGMVQRRVPVARGGIGKASGEVIIPLAMRRAISREDYFGEVVELVLTSLGQQDDDLRIKVGDYVVSDTQWNIGWYKGENFVSSVVPPWQHENNADWWRKIRLTTNQLHAAMGRLPRRGDVVSIDTFDGWGNAWIRNPWTLTATWSGGAVTSYSGGAYETGESVPTPPTISIDVGSLFPLRAGSPGELYGAQTFGPYAYNAELWSRSDDPVGADDDVVINGVPVLQNGVADFVNGGADYKFASVSAGDTWTLDVLNTSGNIGASGTLLVEPVVFAAPAGYYSSGPHFQSYIENGKVTL